MRGTSIVTMEWLSVRAGDERTLYYYTYYICILLGLLLWASCLPVVIVVDLVLHLRFAHECDISMILYMYKYVYVFYDLMMEHNNIMYSVRI